MGIGNGSWKQYSLGGPGDHNTGMGYGKVSVVVGTACTLSFVYALSLLLMSTRPCWNACQSTPCTPLSSLPVGYNNTITQLAVLGSNFSESMPQVNHSAPVKAEGQSIADERGEVANGTSTVNGRRKGTYISRIVFGIAGARDMWWERKEYLKLWWKPSTMRGFVFLDKNPYGDYWVDDWPPYRISENTSQFEYTYKGGSRSAIRISRILSEVLRMDLPNVDWFVMGDDDTLFFEDNLVQVLSKYDHTEMYYIGSNSESHLQNIHFSYNMAFGGGGFAVSYPLAKALGKIQDDCLARYPHLFGSDDRMQACMAELGIPLTKEPGFHQLDVVGDISGLLAAHPVAPLVTLHHLEVVQPIFPNTTMKNFTRVEALKHLIKAAEVEAASILQQSICYDRFLKWSFSVSWGYVVQVHKGFVSPRELQIPLKTFKSWNKDQNKVSFPFNTRDYPEDICQQPTRFFMESVKPTDVNPEGEMEGVFEREYDEKKHACAEILQQLNTVQRIRVLRTKIDPSRSQLLRRSCCRIRDWVNETIDIHVGPCGNSESIISTFG